MNRIDRAIAGYLAGDLIAVRDAFGVAGDRDGDFALDSDECPGSERTLLAPADAYDPEVTIARKVAA